VLLKRKRGEPLTTAFQPRPRALSLALVLVVVAGAMIAVLATAAQAQEPTGATATKDCPQAPIDDPYTIGDTVVCTATFVNDGALPATVTFLTETAPFITEGSPGNGTPIDIECTLPDGTTVINEGDTLAPGVVCTATVGVTIPDDPALCNTVFRDRVEIGLEYPETGPPLLTAGAFATHTLLLICQPTPTTTTAPAARTLAATGSGRTQLAQIALALIASGVLVLAVLRAHARTQE
jgi:hypothetical protein